MDLCELVKFFAKCFKRVFAGSIKKEVPIPKISKGKEEEEEHPRMDGKKVFSLMVETLSQIGNKLLNTDPL